jgi:hypothetical protein
MIMGLFRLGMEKLLLYHFSFLIGVKAGHSHSKSAELRFMNCGPTSLVGIFFCFV